MPCTYFTTFCNAYSTICLLNFDKPYFDKFIITRKQSISRVMSKNRFTPALRIIIYLGLLLPTASSDLPESRPGKPVAFFLSCFGWGLHSPACYHTGGSLLHYPSTLTLYLRRFISVALSLESPPQDVILHPALLCSDFPNAFLHSTI